MSTEAAFLESVGRHPARPFAAALPATRAGRLRSSLPAKVLESRLRAEYDALVDSWEAQRQRGRHDTPAEAASTHAVDVAVGGSAPGAAVATSNGTASRAASRAFPSHSRHGVSAARADASVDAVRGGDRASGTCAGQRFCMGMNPPVFDALHILALDAAAATNAVAPDAPAAAKVLHIGVAAASAAVRAEDARERRRASGDRVEVDPEGESNHPPAGIAGPECDVSVAARRLQPATGVDLEAVVLADARQAGGQVIPTNDEPEYDGDLFSQGQHRSSLSENHWHLHATHTSPECALLRRRSATLVDAAPADPVAAAVRREIERQNRHYARAVVATATGSGGVAAARKLRGQAASTRPTVGKRAPSGVRSAGGSSYTRDVGVSPLAPPKSFVPPPPLGSLALHRRSVSRHSEGGAGGSRQGGRSNRLDSPTNRTLAAVDAPAVAHHSPTVAAARAHEPDTSTEWRARRRHLLDELSACLFRRDDPDSILTALRENAKLRREA
jgi:hypothetical protein